MKAQGRGLPHTSQVLVEHPEQFLQHIKQCLSSKEGIPVKQQRLVFSGPGAQLLEETQENSQQQPAVEEILSSLNQWQAIIFQNGRAIGRSVNLKLYSCTLPESSLYKSEESLAIECFALQLDAWHPSWKARTEDSSPLYIAVDEGFKKSSFHVQLIGRTSRGTNFALPFAYKFEGSAVCSRLDYYDQHVKRHQQSFASLHDTEISGEYSIKFGEGLQSFTAVLDVVDQPHWLKSFVLHFSVLVASKLDDHAEPSVSRAVAPQQSEAPGMASAEQPSTASLLSRAESMHSQNGHSIAPASMAELDKVTDQGWLPAKLLPPKSESSGKQKQPKKRSKQKIKSDAQSGQKGEGDQPDKKGAHDPYSCKPEYAGDSKWELQHADCMDEASNGKAFSDDSAEDHTCRMEGSFSEPAGQHQSGTAPSAGDALHVKQREGGPAAGASSKVVPQPVTPVGTVPDIAVRWRPSNPTGVKIRAGQVTAVGMAPASAQPKYVHPNAASSGRVGYTNDLHSPGRRGGSVWRGGHSSVSSLVVDAAVGEESSSWSSLSEGSDRSASSDVDMTSPVSVGKREGPKKPMAGPGPGQPPRAIPNSPGSASSHSCGPPLDQLLPSQVKDAAPKASSPDAAESAVAKGTGSDSQASVGTGESNGKPAGPFRVLSMNSDRSHAHQDAARSAAVQPAVPVKVQKLQQVSQPLVESSYKVSPKLLVQVRADAPRSNPVAQQPASKPRSPQKRSMPPSTSPFTAYAPSLTPAPVLAWPHVHQQQRSSQMHVPASMDTQLLIEMQRQVSAAEMAAYSAGMRAPVRTQSLPRLQQDARDAVKMQQQRQAGLTGQSGHAGQAFKPQRQANMQQMPQMPPSWHHSPQPPVEARQLLPKQAAVRSAGARASPAAGADMHVPLRHSVPSSPIMAPHSGAFAFHPYSEAPALHQLMQQALSHTFTGQGQPPRSMAMPAGQMLGHPAVRPRPSPYAEPNLQRQTHVPAVLGSLQTVLGMPQPSQPTDIERFLSLTTPTLPAKIGGPPTLAHLWSFYEEASVFGKEVHTTGGSRGPSRAFFVPSLSAMQLFVPPESSAQPSGSLHTLSDAAVAQYPTWPKRMRVLKEVFETAKPYERPALAQRIEQLAAEPCADGQPGSLLKDLPLHQLHPASWVCVAWYPVYRIPDAPLTAKFLTYHSVAPVLCSATHYGALGLAPPRNGHASQPSSALCLPTIGLKCCSLSDASWVDPTPGVPDGPGKGLMRTPSLGSSSEDSSVVTSFDDSHGSARSASLGPSSASAAWEGPENRRSRLAELSLCADWLSRREALGSRNGMQAQHDDYSFFSRNADKSIAPR